MVGIFGIHFFMVGKVGMGIVILFLTLTISRTFVSGIWAFIDFIAILTANFTDKNEYGVIN
ncbi:hypothetical protein BHOIPH601_08880 [Bartonella henselae]